VWLVDKPAGPTSHDVVAGIRRRLGRGVKVGHAGTLDPFATGLLVVMVGRTTRLAAYLTGLDKTYEAVVRLGATSATGDPEGPVEETGAAVPDRGAVEAALAALVGTGRQRVPTLAAVRVGGERLYRRTRRGEAVTPPEREVTVHAADLLGHDPVGGRARIRLRCGKGTYVRQVAADLGERLGCGGYCAELRRLAVGRLSVERAVPPEAVGPDGGLAPLEALAHLPALALDDETASRVRHGARLADVQVDGPVALVAAGELVAVGRPDPSGGVRPAVVLG
jgi:tRNA pseudouridine55 synthase